MSTKKKCVCASIGLGAFLACSGVAEADIVYFENPVGAEHYNWAPGLFSDRWLDIRNAATDQLGDNNGPGSFGQLRSEFVTTLNVIGGQVLHGGLNSSLVWAATDGESIAATPPSNSNWSVGQFIHHPILTSNFAIGQEAYIGVRFDLGSGFHYGWIGVTRTGVTLDAFAWAYETQPGVPIAAGAIPAPAAGVLFGLGLIGASRRRR